MQMPEIDAQDWEEYGDRQIKVNVGKRGGAEGSVQGVKMLDNISLSFDKRQKEKRN